MIRISILRSSKQEPSRNNIIKKNENTHIKMYRT